MRPRPHASKASLPVLTARRLPSSHRPPPITGSRLSSKHQPPVGPRNSALLVSRAKDDPETRQHVLQAVQRRPAAARLRQSRASCALRPTPAASSFPTKAAAWPPSAADLPGLRPSSAARQRQSAVPGHGGDELGRLNIVARPRLRSRSRLVSTFGGRVFLASRLDTPRQSSQRSPPIPFPATVCVSAITDTVPVSAPAVTAATICPAAAIFPLADTWPPATLPALGPCRIPGPGPTPIRSDASAVSPWAAGYRRAGQHLSCIPTATPSERWSGPAPAPATSAPSSIHLFASPPPERHCLYRRASWLRTCRGETRRNIPDTPRRISSTCNGAQRRPDITAAYEHWAQHRAIRDKTSPQPA